jgi:pSer/pThr/pTyr-binding forkhead associated (FHA) protein
MIRLNADSYVLGRSSDADIPLFSPTASRRHALLLRREGEWFLQPEESKLVIAAGTPVVKEIRLTHKMRLQLGDDELLFFDARPSAAATERPATDRTPEPKAGEQSNAFLGVVILVILAVVAAAIWMLLGH